MPRAPWAWGRTCLSCHSTGRQTRGYRLRFPQGTSLITPGCAPCTVVCVAAHRRMANRGAPLWRTTLLRTGAAVLPQSRANDRCWSYSTVAAEKTTIVGGTSALGWWSTGKVWRAAVGGGGMGEGSCSCKCLSPPRGGGACGGVQKSDTRNPLCDISFICVFFYGALDSHPFTLHRTMQRRSSPEGSPSRCLDPSISVSLSAAGCGGQDIENPYGINHRSAPRPAVWHPCCPPPPPLNRGNRLGTVVTICRPSKGEGAVLQIAPAEIHQGL